MILNKRHPALIVLQSLLDGYPATIEGEEYWMDEETREVVIRRESMNTQTGEKKEVFLRIDMNVGAFFKMCEKLPEKAVIEIAANKVLNDLRRGKLRGTR